MKSMLVIFQPFDRSGTRRQLVQSSTAKFGTFWKSTSLRVKTVMSLARAMAAILRSIVPMRMRWRRRSLKTSAADHRTTTLAH